MTIQTIGIVGAGSMGSGIANLAALHGFTVILHDIEERYLDHAVQRMNGFMTKRERKGAWPHSTHYIIRRYERCGCNY